MSIDAIGCYPKSAIGKELRCNTQELGSARRIGYRGRAGHHVSLRALARLRG